MTDGKITKQRKTARNQPAPTSPQPKKGLNRIFLEDLSPEMVKSLFSEGRGYSGFRVKQDTAIILPELPIQNYMEFTNERDGSKYMALMLALDQEPEVLRQVQLLDKVLEEICNAASLTNEDGQHIGVYCSIINEYKKSKALKVNLKWPDWEQRKIRVDTFEQDHLPEKNFRGNVKSMIRLSHFDMHTTKEDNIDEEEIRTGCTIRPLLIDFITKADVVAMEDIEY